MIVLGIDACLARCSAALLRGDAVLARRDEAMARGHVERLAPMVGEIVEEAGIAPGDLGLVGVTCGPGGFTGARLGVAFARGLALATGCRAVGVTTLEALAFPLGPERRIVALDGRRGDLFVQVFGNGGGTDGPSSIAAEDLPAFAERHGSPPVLGPDPLPPVDPADVARLARTREGEGPPRPLYLRAPDAVPAPRPALR